MSSSKTRSDQEWMPRSQEELDRLDNQHKALRISRAPKDYLAKGIKLDLSSGQSCRVLDLGAANGRWSSDLADLYTNPRLTFTNLDKTESYLPAKPYPPRQDFVAYDLLSTSPPRPDLAEGFDLVHMRLMFHALPKHPEFTIEDALAKVTQFVKPGGWVQLDEVDVSVPFQGKLAQQFHDLFPAVDFEICKDERINQLAQTLRGLLEAQGYKDVGVESHDFRVGKAMLGDVAATKHARDVMERHADDSKWLAERFIKQIKDLHPQGYLSLTPEDYRAFPEQLKQDLLDNGQTWKFFTVYGSKS